MREESFRKGKSQGDSQENWGEDVFKNRQLEQEERLKVVIGGAGEIVCEDKTIVY